MPVSRIWDEDNATWQIVGGSYSPDLSDATYLRLDALNSPVTGLPVFAAGADFAVDGFVGDGSDKKVRFGPASGDHLYIEEYNGGDFWIRNDQQDNGIKIADGSGGVEITYAGATVTEWDSSGGLKVTTGQMRVLEDGSATAPAIRFGAFGLYPSSATNFFFTNLTDAQVGWDGGVGPAWRPSSANSGAADLGNTSSSWRKVYLTTANSTAGAPSFTWAGDPDTGMFHDSANSIGFSTAGVERMQIGTSGVNFSAGVAGAATIKNNGTGSQSTPVYTFNGDLDTGIYEGGSNVLRFTAGGTYRMDVTTTAVKVREHLVLTVSGHSLGWSFTPSIGTGDFAAYLDDDGSGDWTWRVGTTASTKESKLKRYSKVNYRELADQLLAIPMRGWQYRQDYLDSIEMPKESPNRNRVYPGFIAEEVQEKAPWLAAEVDGEVKVKDGRPLTFGIIATLKALSERIEELEAMLVT